MLLPTVTCQQSPMKGTGPFTPAASQLTPCCLWFGMTALAHSAAGDCAQHQLIHAQLCFLAPQSCAGFIGGNETGAVPAYGLPTGQAQQMQLHFMRDQLRQELQQRSFLSHAQVQSCSCWSCLTLQHLQLPSYICINPASDLARMSRTHEMALLVKAKHACIG